MFDTGGAVKRPGTRIGSARCRVKSSGRAIDRYQAGTACDAGRRQGTHGSQCYEFRAISLRRDRLCLCNARHRTAGRHQRSELSTLQAVINAIEATTDSGGSWQVEPTTISVLSVPEGEPDPGGPVTVYLLFSAGPSKVLDASGEEVRSFEAIVDHAEQLVLVPKGSSWSMLHYSSVA